MTVIQNNVHLYTLEASTLIVEVGVENIMSYSLVNNGVTVEKI